MTSFSVWKTCQPDNGYLVDHSFKFVFDFTVVSRDFENADFDILRHTFDILDQLRYS